MWLSTLPPSKRGILLMIAAIVCFTIMDALGKAVSKDLGVIMTVWARYLSQLMLVVILLRKDIWTHIKVPNRGLQLLRATFQLGAFLLFFHSLVHLKLAEATAIFEIAPVLITLGAGIFLGERFGLQRTIGVGVGLIGMMIIVRPGSDVFSPYAFYTLAAATCFAGYALVTRFLGASQSFWASLVYSGLFGTIIMSVLVPFQWITPTPFQFLLLAALGGFGILAQMCLVTAFMNAEASALAPFSYVSLIGSSLWGFLFFGEVPDIYMILGAFLIAGSGIFIWYRETKN